MKQVDHHHPSGQDKGLSMSLSIMLEVNSECSLFGFNFGVIIEHGLGLSFKIASCTVTSKLQGSRFDPALLLVWAFSVFSGFLPWYVVH